LWWVRIKHQWELQRLSSFSKVGLSSNVVQLSYKMTVSLWKYLMVFLVLLNSIETTTDPKTHIICDEYIKNDQWNRTTSHYTFVCELKSLRFTKEKKKKRKWKVNEKKTRSFTEMLHITILGVFLLTIRILIVPMERVFCVNTFEFQPSHEGVSKESERALKQS